MELKVKFEKVGEDKVKYTIPVRMFCNQMNKELSNTNTLIKTDGLFKMWLGDVDKAFEKKNVISKVVNIRQVYDSCDNPM